MKHIYVLVSLRENRDAGASHILANTDAWNCGPPHPAFESRAAAEKYAAELKGASYSVLELELWS